MASVFRRRIARDPRDFIIINPRVLRERYHHRDIRDALSCSRKLNSFALRDFLSICAAFLSYDSRDTSRNVLILRIYNAFLSLSLSLLLSLPSFLVNLYPEILTGCAKKRFYPRIESSGTAVPARHFDWNLHKNAKRHGSVQKRSETFQYLI